MKTSVLLAATLTLLWASGPLWSMEATPEVNRNTDMSSCNRMLSHYSPAQAVKVINAMCSEGEVDAGWSAPDNSVIVRAALARCQQIEDLLGILDSPEPLAPSGPDVERKLTVFHLKYSLASTMANALNTAFEDRAFAQADSRTNALLVMAPAENMERVRDCVAVLDSPLSARPSVTPAMETAPAPGPEFRQPRRAAQPRMPQPVLAEQELITQVYGLRYGEAEQIARILLELLHRREDITLVPNAAGNQILVSASPDSQRLVRELIQELDIPPAGQSQNMQMLCRVFMLELAAEDKEWKPFLLTLWCPNPLGVLDIERVVISAGLKSVNIREGEPSGGRTGVLYTIEGRAAAEDAVKGLFERFGDTSRVLEFRWQDTSITTSAPTSGIESLSEPLKEHLHRLLGEDLQPAGYWFGDLSLPGEVRAPIGPWTLELTMEPEERDELTFEIGVEQMTMGGRGGPGGIIILSNSGRGRIGKPIIIGYNRDRGGARVMGALVIIPEPADPTL